MLTLDEAELRQYRNILYSLQLFWQLFWNKNEKEGANSRNTKILAILGWPIKKPIPQSWFHLVINTEGLQTSGNSALLNKQIVKNGYPEPNPHSSIDLAQQNINPWANTGKPPQENNNDHIHRLKLMWKLE